MILKDSNTGTQAHQQQRFKAFFSPITPTHATSQSRGTQIGSRPEHCKGLTIDQAIAICRAHRPQPRRSQPQVLPSLWRPLHSRPMLEIFQGQNYNISNLRILHV